MKKTLPFLILAALVAAGCNIPRTPTGCIIENATLTEQAFAQSQTTQIQLEATRLQEEVVKRSTELELAVAKACVENGGAPQFSGGNVQCINKR